MAEPLEERPTPPARNPGLSRGTASQPDGPYKPARPEPGSVQRLASATRNLAATVAATERLAERRAELLRTMDAAVGMNGRGSHADSRAIISLSEVARRTGRHPEVLRRWCADGRIPAVRVGRTWAVSGDTLAMLLAHAARSRPRFATRDGDT